MGSVNREIAYQQQVLAEKIRALKETLVLPIEERLREAEALAASGKAVVTDPVECGSVSTVARPPRSISRARR